MNGQVCKFSRMLRLLSSRTKTTTTFKEIKQAMHTITIRETRITHSMLQMAVVTALQILRTTWVSQARRGTSITLTRIRVTGPMMICGSTAEGFGL
jgi:hypothetical protein